MTNEQIKEYVKVEKFEVGDVVVCLFDTAVGRTGKKFFSGEKNKVYTIKESDINYFNYLYEDFKFVSRDREFLFMLKNCKDDQELMGVAQYIYKQGYDDAL